MGRRCIADLVNGVHGCIHCRIKANAVIGTCNIQVDRSRNAHRIDSLCRQLLSSCKRTVSADDYQAVNPVPFADLRTLLLSLFCPKF